MLHSIASKQKLLIKAACGSLDEAGRFLTEWAKRYQLNEMDWETRSILPIILQKNVALDQIFPEKETLKRYHYYYQMTWLNNLKKFKSFALLLQQFNQENIEVSLLKGAAMLLGFYKNFGMRPFENDIDLFVKRSQIACAIQILRKNHYYPIPFFQYSGEVLEKKILNNDPRINFLHAITYSNGVTTIDLHWKIMQFSHLTLINWQPIIINGANAFILPIELQLIHTIVHGMSQLGVNKTCWWMTDAIYLIQNHPNMNWTYIALALERKGLSIYFIKFFKMMDQILERPFVNQNHFMQQLTQSKSHILHYGMTSRFYFVKKISYYLAIYFYQNTFTIQKRELSIIKFFKHYFGYTSYSTLFLKIGRQLLRSFMG